MAEFADKVCGGFFNNGVKGDDGLALILAAAVIKLTRRVVCSVLL